MDDVARLVGEGYDRAADAYEALEEGTEWPRLCWLRDLLDRVTPGGRVLDLGCGNGVPAMRALAERGHDVVGVDVSREQLERARRNVPQAELVLASALDLELEPGSLDAVVSFYAIEHMPRETHARLLASIHDWLRPGGWLLVTFESGDLRDTVGTWLGVPMFVGHFDDETNGGLVRGAGFEIVRSARETQLEGGRRVEYLWILAQR